MIRKRPLRPLQRGSPVLMVRSRDHRIALTKDDQLVLEPKLSVSGGLYSELGGKLLDYPIDHREASGAEHLGDLQAELFDLHRYSLLLQADLPS